MKLGVFAKTYDRKSIEATLDAVKADGLSSVQLKMTQVGLPTLPDAVPSSTLDRIRRATESRGIEITAISATYNMAHPDPAVRKQGLHRLEVLARAARRLDVPYLTLCSGTRNLDDIWAYHPDNVTFEAWNEMTDSMMKATQIAEATGVRMGIEPEPGNIIQTAEMARGVIADTGSDAMGAILDPANIVDSSTVRNPTDLLEEAISFLAEVLFMVHGKDTSGHGHVRAPGRGIIPWQTLLPRLDAFGFDGPVLMHGFDEADVPGAVAYLTPIIDGLSPTPGTPQS